MAWHPPGERDGRRAWPDGWDNHEHGAARLITATEATGSSARLDVGLQLKLTPGWHTYWRSPGDAGIAPTVDWTGSENLARAAIAWPAPQRLPSLDGLETIGYVDGVTLPIAVTLAHPGAPLRRAARLGLLATAAGILASFGVLAAALIGLKAAGAAIGRGIQFQQPWFLAGMALATTLFAASLWDWLPIGLPGGMTGALTAVRGRSRLGDAFVLGALATLLATSCSAPFVGTAVGFALARGPLDIALVFGALGLGMAAPFLAVAGAPVLVTWLPRPGPWMGWLRRVLGLALLGTAGWLLFVLAIEAGHGAALLTGAGLAILLAVLAWRHRGPAHRRTATVAAKKLVFVDVTAAWCLTCKVNELAVLDREPVAERLRDSGVVAMRADWTRSDPAITAYLQGFGRFGVPLDVVYGPVAPEGIALPELLSAHAVMDAFRRAARALAKEASE